MLRVLCHNSHDQSLGREAVKRGTSSGERAGGAVIGLVSTKQVESQLTYHLDKLGSGVELISTRLENAGHYDPDHPSLPKVELPSVFGEDSEEALSNPNSDVNEPSKSVPLQPQQPKGEIARSGVVHLEDDQAGLVLGTEMRFGSTHSRSFDSGYDRPTGGMDDSIGRVKYIDVTNDRKPIVPVPLGGHDTIYDRMGNAFGGRNNRIQARKVDSGSAIIGNEVDRGNIEDNGQKVGMYGLVATHYPDTLPLPPSYGTTTPSTTIITTTREPTTTLPEKYCRVDRDSRSHILEEGTSIRLYPNGNKDCSEHCSCSYGSETICTPPSLACPKQVLKCVEERPCEAKFAVFNHNAPAFQAYRGRCICYSGDFICMRPPPGFDSNQHLNLISLSSPLPCTVNPPSSSQSKYGND
ncbi:hypothetical protein FHG87_006044 [Trinorchestia longiramus]|nr:hypothetical protein FHG87_006044 [Trinorchestia longiramus]